MDERYHEIRKYVQKQERVSVSHLQRKFRIGWERASRIIKMLEDNKVIGTRDNIGYRKVIQRIYVWNV